MTMTRRGAIWTAAAAGLAVASRSGAQSHPVVDCPAGALEGRTEGGTRAFKGVPYALPPIGALRWRPPMPMQRWSGVRSAAEFGPACFQPSSRWPGNIYADDPPRMSEDCLSLNIWAPEGAKDAPVFFWIHGGALSSGFSGQAMYDGARLAQRGVVVVTINYRLGVLGYMAHPDLSAESPLRVSGNYGLLDQIQALRWVQANIAAFGGDPANVTIAGESAGGLSVLYLMASPVARGLFAKAIAESAYMISSPELKTRRHGLPAAEAVGEMVMSGLQAPSLAALRAMDAGELTNASAKLGFGPLATVDGQVLTAQMVETFESGAQAPVPVLAGFNSGEIRALTVLAPPTPATAEAYEKAIRERYLDLSDAFLKLYPATNLRESVLAATRDGLYGWTAERTVRDQTAMGLASYLYLFDHAIPAAEAANLHGFHASELPYVFGTLDRTPPHWPKAPATPGEARLSDAMMDYWTSFARSGRPQAVGQPDWPAYGEDGGYMAFEDAPKPGTHLMPGMYALHEAAVCRRREAGDEPWNWNVGLASPRLADPAGRCPLK